jgi:DNA-binding transcriptional LysR family regulator
MHSHAEFDWDDLRHFLAVARHGSTIQAAKALGMNQSTVQRRIAALERQLGRRLFDRCPEGYRLTRLGEELRPIAERVETDISDFSRQSASSHTELVGTIRVTCPETAGYRIIKSPILDAFHARYPGLRVEMVMVDRVLDLAKGEADIAFRTSVPRDDALVARKIAEVAPTSSAEAPQRPLTRSASTTWSSSMDRSPSTRARAGLRDSRRRPE